LGTGILAANGPDSWLWWDWIPDHSDDIRTYLLEHARITAIAVAIGFVVALPLAVVAARVRRLSGPIQAATSILFTIPSVALLGLLLPVTGLGLATAVLALALYSLDLLVRNMTAGLRAVPTEVLDAARGMGFGSFRRLVRIELPLALPSIFAAVRLATISTIGLVAVTFIVNQGGLGRFILVGYERDFHTPLVVGATLSVLLALVADGLLRAVEWLVTPWRRAVARR
jgi:osmoprotectant transport system permease protein